MPLGIRHLDVVHTFDKPPEAASLEPDMTNTRINDIFRRLYISRNSLSDIATIVIFTSTYSIYRGKPSAKRDEADDAETMFASSGSVMPIGTRCEDLTLMPTGQ